MLPRMWFWGTEQIDDGVKDRESKGNSRLVGGGLRCHVGWHMCGANWQLDLGVWGIGEQARLEAEAF